MRRLRVVLWVGLVAILLSGYFILRSFGLIGGTHLARAQPVPFGDQEVAYLQTATSGAAWERLVAGIHRVQKRWPELSVDDRNAFPEQSAAVPEVVLSFPGSPGRLWIRWYKMTSDANTAHWVNELAQRSTPPLAIVGGGSSDRARDLAEALQARRDSWPGAAPLLLITTATADTIDIFPEEKALITIYEGRSYRFCFTNSQMAEAIWDFVWTQDDLRPYARPNPLNPLLPAGIAQLVGGDLWGSLPFLMWGGVQGPPVMVHIVEWLDDPYSRDFALQFRNLLANPEGPELPSYTHSVNYSVGGYSTPNPREAQVVQRVRAMLNFRPPEPEERFLLIVPAGDKPVRRLLRSLSLNAPRETGNFVVVTGDSIQFTTLYRDRHFAWNIQELPFPLVMFCHHNPVAWAEAIAANPEAPTAPPPNYSEIGTDEELLDADIVRLLVEAAYRLETRGELQMGPHALPQMIANADELNAEIRRRRQRYFGPEGNRRGGNGEFLVCLRPVLENGRVLPEASIEVWKRQTRGQTMRVWERIAQFRVDYGDGQREVPHGAF